LGASSYNIAATNGAGGFWITQKQAGTVNGSYSFTLVVAPGTGASVTDHVGNANEGKTYISAWNLDSWSGTTGNTLPAGYTVTVQSAHVNGGAAIVWTAAELYRASAPGTTQVGSLGFWYDYSGHYSDFGSAYAAGEIINVTVQNAPEPGSILALGSGMMGLVGFAIRRRRA
jgi:hypothetical protein